MNKKHIGSDFNDYLREEGIFESIDAAVTKKLFALELRDAMKAAGVSEAELARKMGATGRSTLRRLLDPANQSATLSSMSKAASALGAGIEIKLVLGSGRRKTKSARRKAG